MCCPPDGNDDEIIPSVQRLIYRPPGGDAADLSQHRLMAILDLLGEFAAVVISADDDRRFAGRIGDCEVIALVGDAGIAPGPCLVAHPPLRGKARPQALAAGSGGNHPVNQRLAGGGFEQISGRQPRDKLRHCSRRRRIAQVCREHHAEHRLITVQPRQRVAHLAKQRGDPGGTAEPAHQKIGGRAIADFLCRLRQGGDGHAAVGKMVAGHRCPIEQVGFGKGQALAQIEPTAICRPQAGADHRELEGGAQSEMFIQPVAGHLKRRRVEKADAQPRMPDLKLTQTLHCIDAARAGGGQACLCVKRSSQRRRARQKTASFDHVLPPGWGVDKTEDIAVSSRPWPR